MSLLFEVRQDLESNRGNRKGQFIAFCYRLSNYLFYNKSPIIRILGFPIRKTYHILCKWIMGVEIPEQAIIGSNLTIWHGQGLVINHKVIIGSNVMLRHCTTIGNKYKGSGCPKIGNNVDIGSNTVIIGEIEIGDNVTIGAGTVVTKSISANSIAYGNPMQIKSK